MLVSDTGCCAQKMMKHSKKTGCAPNRTHPAKSHIRQKLQCHYNTGVFGGRGWITQAALLKTAHWAVFALSSATAPQLFESTLGYALKSFGQKKNSSIFTTLEFLVGAGGFEPPKLKSSRFTVCPHWPLGNTPIYSFSQSRTACIYYHLGAYLSTAFYSFFRKEADRTAQSRGRP